MLAAAPVTIGELDVMGVEVIGAAVVAVVDVLNPLPLELHAARPAPSASTATAAGTRRTVLLAVDMVVSLLDVEKPGKIFTPVIRRRPGSGLVAMGGGSVADQWRRSGGFWRLRVTTREI
jgi:hypothetical protein